MLDLVSPERRGLTSVAPKQRTPVTVVSQSRKPMRIMAEKNKSSFFMVVPFFGGCFLLMLWWGVTYPFMMLSVISDMLVYNDFDVWAQNVGLGLLVFAFFLVIVAVVVLYRRFWGLVCFGCCFCICDVQVYGMN